MIVAPAFLWIVSWQIFVGEDSPQGFRRNFPTVGIGVVLDDENSTWARVAGPSYIQTSACRHPPLPDCEFTR